MTENPEEVLIDLLIKKATYGLEPDEQAELNLLENGRHDESFDLTVSAIALIDERTDELLPSHLKANIKVSAESFFDEKEAADHPSTIRTLAETSPKLSLANWLGWAMAAAACIALAVNIYMTRVADQQVVVAPPTPTPERLDPVRDREKLMGSAGDMVKASWSKGNVEETSTISGDIVWSDTMQKGYMRLKGLPVNDPNKEQYQLWIFDASQSAKTPIDGGVFDVSENGEVVIPVNAKLKAQKPYQFAITIERPGGVVVSDDKRIAALGKV